jgi:type I restriction enzyme R subunit
VRTVAPPSDPNLLYDTRHDLDEFGVLVTDEMATFARLLLQPSGVDHPRLHAALGPAIDRFWGLVDDDTRERFRDALGRFVRVYAFVSQVVPFTDTNLERDYLFCRALAAFVRDDAGEAVDVSGAVELTHLRNEQQFSGSVSLSPESGEVATIWSGTGKVNEPEPEPLSLIIDRLNSQYGTDWHDADRLVFDAALADLVADSDVQVTAVNNTAENFGVVFPELFQKALLGRMDRNEKVVFRYLDDPDLAAEVSKVYGALALARARVGYQEHCPIGELLSDAGGENAHLEYKSTLRTGAETGEVIKALETACIKTVAAFLNSREGGTLLIGVADDATVHGLASDYASLHKDGKDDRDRFQLHLSQLLVNAVGEAAASTVSIQLHTIEGADLCRVHVPPSGFPVDAHVTVERAGKPEKKTAFYVRLANGTREIADQEERRKYIASRWGTASS